MTRPNITKGPWAANVDTVWTGSSPHLMTCFPLHNEQSRANAQAIAALPDLLAALEKALSLLECANDHQREAGRLEYDTQTSRDALTKAGYSFP